MTDEQKRTATPSTSALQPDSGYYSPTDTLFAFHSDDMAVPRSSSADLRPEPDSPTLAWDISNGQVFQRRRRTQSDPTGRFCEIRTRSVATQTSEPLPASSLTGEIQPLTLAQRQQMDWVGGRMRAMADDFDADLQGAFIGARFPNNAMVGVFAAVPLPPWAQNMLEWLGLGRFVR